MRDRTRSPGRSLFKKSRTREAKEQKRQIGLLAHQGLEKVQGTGIRPMDILQEYHNCLTMRNVGNKFGAVVEGEITHLTGVVQDAFQVFAARVIQPDQVTDEVSIER